MPDVDDDQFETHMKRFRPLAAEPLQTVSNPPRIRRSLTLAACAGVAAVLIVAVFAMYSRKARPRIRAAAPALQLANLHAITAGSANELLVHAPSFEAALGALTFHPQNPPIPRGARSALAVLSKEDIKL